MGVQKQLLDGRLEVSLRAKAPFGLGEQVQEYYRQRLHQQTKEVHYSLWNISLGIFYHLNQGNEKPKPPATHPIPRPQPHTSGHATTLIQSRTPSDSGTLSNERGAVRSDLLRTAPRPLWG